MKNKSNIFAYFLILTGVVWILQGVNILPGSLMTGQIEWAVAGVAALIYGVYRLRKSKKSTD